MDGLDATAWYPKHNSELSLQLSLDCVEAGGQPNAFARECVADKMQYSCSELTGIF